MLRVFTHEMFLKQPRATVYNFFSDPHNLSLITPKKMGFKILTPEITKIKEGQVLDYTLTILSLFKIRWTTYITQVKPMESFSDIQMKGPYSYWHHKHEFKSINNGTLIKDTIHYKIPFGIFSGVFNKFFVKKDLEHVFKYRKKMVKELFGG